MEQNKDNIKARKWQQITERVRYQIEALFSQGLTPERIGMALEPVRDRRTIERELAKGMVIQRNSGWIDKSVYLADAAQRVTDERAANKGRGLKIGHDHKLAKYLEQKIGEEKWSPDAAIGAIKEQGLKFDVSLCTKTVYNMIGRGDFLNITNKDLPVKKDGKKRSYNKVRKVALNNTRGRSIEERPLEVNHRQEFGHWEVDCLVGSSKVSLLVLTERVSRKELIFKLAQKTQENVIAAIDGLEQHFEQLGKGSFKKHFKSFTMDNGGEFLDMHSLERSCFNPSEQRTTCYYAHPYSSWERGSNENANKLIRRFIPKGSDIAGYSDEDIKRIQNWMNNYPRRIFGYKTANQIAA